MSDFSCQQSHLKGETPLVKELEFWGPTSAGGKEPNVMWRAAAEIKRLRAAMQAIVDRSQADPLGTSKVIDMRNIAVEALGGSEK